jgi:nickel-type superoxide dismutase maturation protease
VIPLFKFKIEGNSMLPTFKPGDLVLVNRLAYFFNKPRIGDLIVLKTERYIIKRINKIKNNKIFVIGDNKKESTDSRIFGWVNTEKIIGKTVFKI